MQYNASNEMMASGNAVLLAVPTLTKGNNDCHKITSDYLNTNKIRHSNLIHLQEQVVYGSKLLLIWMAAIFDVTTQTTPTTGRRSSWLLCCPVTVRTALTIVLITPTNFAKLWTLWQAFMWSLVSPNSRPPSFRTSSRCAKWELVIPF